MQLKQEIDLKLELKANKQSVSNALHMKANKSDVEQVLSSKVDSQIFSQLHLLVESKLNIDEFDR